MIVVGLKDGFSFLPPSALLYLNGEKINISRSLSYYTPFGRNLALVFEVMKPVKMESNLLALHILGVTSSFDFDVYDMLAGEETVWRGP